MSLILEALKKAERQHRLGEVPGIGSTSMTEETAPSRGRTFLLLLGVALGMLLLGAYLGRPGAPPQPEEEAEVKSLPPLPAPLSPDPARTPEPPLPASVQVPSARLPVKPPAEVSESRPEAPPAVEQAAAPAPAAIVEAPSKPAVVVPAPPPERHATPAPKQMSELPDGFVSNMPTLNIDIHSFDERPGRSYVLINMEKYREGDYLAEGPLLSKILRDGVILEYMGERFILPIGNY